MMIPKQKQLRDEKHLAWLRTLPCCISKVQGGSQAAHIRKGTDGATGVKPSDFWAVPLHVAAHANQHNIGEVSFWRSYGGVERAKKLARDLYKVTGNDRAARELIEEFN